MSLAEKWAGLMEVTCICLYGFCTLIQAHTIMGFV